jgi:hypothetical protein
VRHVADALGEVPAVAEGIGELSVALAPERIGELVADLGAGAERSASTSSVSICSTVAVPPMVSGETMPASGNSLPTCTGDPAMSSSTVMTAPPGSGIRSRSCAPKAFAYQAAASAASGTTMWALTGTPATLRGYAARVLYA